MIQRRKSDSAIPIFYETMCGSRKELWKCSDFLKKIACVLFDTQTVNIKFAEVMDARILFKITENAKRFKVFITL